MARLRALTVTIRALWPEATLIQSVLHMRILEPTHIYCTMAHPCLRITIYPQALRPCQMHVAVVMVSANTANVLLCMHVIRSWYMYMIHACINCIKTTVCICYRRNNLIYQDHRRGKACTCYRMRKCLHAPWPGHDVASA